MCPYHFADSYSYSNFIAWRQLQVLRCARTSLLLLLHAP